MVWLGFVCSSAVSSCVFPLQDFLPLQSVTHHQEGLFLSFESFSGFSGWCLICYCLCLWSWFGDWDWLAGTGLQSNIDQSCTRAVGKLICTSQIWRSLPDNHNIAGWSFQLLFLLTPFGKDCSSWLIWFFPSYSCAIRPVVVFWFQKIYHKTTKVTGDLKTAKYMFKASNSPRGKRHLISL